MEKDIAQTLYMFPTLWPLLIKIIWFKFFFCVTLKMCAQYVVVLTVVWISPHIVSCECAFTFAFAHWCRHTCSPGTVSSRKLQQSARVSCYRRRIERFKKADLWTAVHILSLERFKASFPTHLSGQHEWQTEEVNVLILCGVSVADGWLKQPRPTIQSAWHPPHTPQIHVDGMI